MGYPLEDLSCTCSSQRFVRQSASLWPSAELICLFHHMDRPANSRLARNIGHKKRAGNCNAQACFPLEEEIELSGQEN